MITVRYVQHRWALNTREQKSVLKPKNCFGITSIQCWAWAIILICATATCANFFSGAVARDGTMKMAQLPSTA